MKLSSRSIIGLLVLIFLMVSVMPVGAKSFPHKSIIWIVPFSPGGGLVNAQYAHSTHFFLRSIRHPRTHASVQPPDFLVLSESSWVKKPFH